MSRQTSPLRNLTNQSRSQRSSSTTVHPSSPTGVPITLQYGDQNNFKSAPEDPAPTEPAPSQDKAQLPTNIEKILHRQCVLPSVLTALSPVVPSTVAAMYYRLDLLKTQTTLRPNLGTTARVGVHHNMVDLAL